MNQTPQRANWDGHPVDLGDAWVMRKSEKVARCSLVTHQFGFELRPHHDGLGPLPSVPSSDSADDAHAGDENAKTFAARTTNLMQRPSFGVE